MALTVTTEADVVLTAGANTEVVDALVGRKAVTIQVQAAGRVWIKLGGAAAVDEGVKVNGGDIITIDAGFDAQGNATDFYEGAVNVFWEGGGVDPATNLPFATANCRVIELS